MKTFREIARTKASQKVTEGLMEKPKTYFPQLAQGTTANTLRYKLSVHQKRASLKTNLLGRRAQLTIEPPARHVAIVEAVSRCRRGYTHWLNVIVVNQGFLQLQ